MFDEDKERLEKEERMAGRSEREGEESMREVDDREERTAGDARIDEEGEGERSHKSQDERKIDDV